MIIIIIYLQVFITSFRFYFLKFRDRDEDRSHGSTEQNKKVLEK